MRDKTYRVLQAIAGDGSLVERVREAHARLNQMVDTDAHGAALTKEAQENLDEIYEGFRQMSASEGTQQLAHAKTVRAHIVVFVVSILTGRGLRDAPGPSVRAFGDV